MRMRFKAIFFSLLLLVFCSPIVSAAIGVAHPVPSTFELLRGEEGRFKFQIQAVAHPYDIECKYSLDEVSDLRIEFDVETVTVASGSSALILGSVFVPEGAEFGMHEETFCVDCANVGAGGGTQVLGRYCSIPVRVEVVPVRTRENVFVPAKVVSYLWLYVLVGVVALLILIMVLYLYFKRKKTREFRVEVKPEQKVEKKPVKKRK